MSLVLTHAPARRLPEFRPHYRWSDLHLRWDRVAVLALLLAFWTIVGVSLAGV